MTIIDINYGETAAKRSITVTDNNYFSFMLFLDNDLQSLHPTQSQTVNMN